MQTMKYIGDGSTYFPGVPMRDMTRNEWYALPAQTRAALVNNGLFKGPYPQDVERPESEETPVFEEGVLEAAIETAEGDN